MTEDLVKYKKFKAPKADKQLKFCREYRKDRNATQAAIRAGYKDTPAVHTTGWQLLQNPAIVGYIARLDAEEAARANISREDIINLAREIIQADPTDYMEIDGTFVLNKNSPNRRAVQEVKIDDHYDESGQLHRKMTLKLRDPMVAAERVAKLLGLDEPPPPEHHKFTFEIVRDQPGGSS